MNLIKTEPLSCGNCDYYQRVTTPNSTTHSCSEFGEMIQKITYSDDNAVSTKGYLFYTINELICSEGKHSGL